jgi:hypothetical protein
LLAEGEEERKLGLGEIEGECTRDRELGVKEREQDDGRELKLDETMKKMRGCRFRKWK